MLPVRAFLSAMLRRYPFDAGFETIGLSKPLALFARHEPYSVVRLRNGAQMLVYGKDHVGRILLYMGDFEPRITRIAEALLRPGDTVLDIGSNMGWFTLTAAKLVGPSGTIHAFEPQPKLNTLLRASLAMNDFENVKIHEVALSGQDAAATLYVLSGNLGAARLSAERGDGWSPLNIRTVQAGDYLNSLQLPSVRLLKIDVEGHEDTVFQAAHSFFQRSPPEIIVFESAGQCPLWERPVAKTLSSHGYRLFSLPTALRTKVVPACADQAQRTIDHIALLDGPAFAVNAAALRVVAPR